MVLSAKIVLPSQFCTRFCIRLLLNFNAICLKSSSPHMRSNWLGVEPIIHCTQEPVERSKPNQEFLALIPGKLKHTSVIESLQWTSSASGLYHQNLDWVHILVSYRLPGSISNISIFSTSTASNPPSQPWYISHIQATCNRPSPGLTADSHWRRNGRRPIAQRPIRYWRACWWLLPGHKGSRNMRSLGQRPPELLGKL